MIVVSSFALILCPNWSQQCADSHATVKFPRKKKKIFLIYFLVLLNLLQPSHRVPPFCISPIEKRSTRPLPAIWPITRYSFSANGWRRLLLLPLWAPDWNYLQRASSAERHPSVLSLLGQLRVKLPSKSEICCGLECFQGWKRRGGIFISQVLFGTWGCSLNMGMFVCVNRNACVNSIGSDRKM